SRPNLCATPSFKIAPFSWITDSSLFFHLPMILVLVVLLVAWSGSVSTTPNLSLSVSLRKSLSIDEPSVISLVTNTGNHSLKLLNHPQSVLSHLPTRVFRITQGNTTVDFTGIIVNYSPHYVARKNNSVDFTYLAPGQTHEQDHVLTEAYDFTRTGPGEYCFKTYSRFYHVDESGNIVVIDAEASSARFEVTRGLARPRKISFNRLNSFAVNSQMLQSGCTADQQNVIIEAATYADQYISNALTYLQSINGNTPRYQTWFGIYEPQQAETVKSHYANSVGRAMTSAYDCMPDSCRDGAIAYVWPQQPGVIHFCAWFWSRPPYGSNSKAGTIIHELSHFTGTEDHVYGEVGSLELARSAPMLAVTNADSYMYFAENSLLLQ
ncbi:unnamed protein product, partial [Rhizoctonia solani]